MVKAAALRALANKSRSLANTAGSEELRQALLESADHYDSEADKLAKVMKPEG
jgi:hypothetical protein